MQSFFVSSGVQNRTNAQASDHLMHVERISILWLQNRDRTDISYHGIGSQFDFKQLKVQDWYHEEEQASERHTG